MSWLWRSDRALGLAGVVAGLIVALGVGLFSFIPFGQRHYVAQLEHTAGLKVGEEVQVHGVPAGEIRAIHLAGKLVEVEFTLDREIRLGDRTRATVEVATLLGTHALQVEPAGEGSLSEATIPLDRTTVPFNLQDVIEGSTGTLTRLDGATVATSLRTLADALRDTPDDVQRALDGVGALSAAAAKRSDQMAALLKAASGATGALAASTEDVVALMEQTTVLLEEMNRRRDLIHRMLVNARKLGEQTSGVLTDSDAELDGLVKDFSVALDALQKHEDDITGAIEGLATMSHYFANASGNGPWIDVHVPSAVSDNLACLPGCD